MTCIAGLLVRDSQVLLGLRSALRVHYPDVWDIIGGHAHLGERPYDEVVRELQEEIGVTPTHVSLLHVARYSGPVETYDYHIYLVTTWKGTPENLQPEEHAQIGWVSPEQFERMRFAHPAYPDLLRRAVELTREENETVQSDGCENG